MHRPPKRTLFPYTTLFRSQINIFSHLSLGDSSALSHWTYIDHPEIAFMMVMFSLLIVIYLMNLFIGLLSNEIDKNNNRDRKSTRLNSSHGYISYAVSCLKK